MIVFGAFEPDAIESAATLEAAVPVSYPSLENSKQTTPAVRLGITRVLTCSPGSLNIAGKEPCPY